LANLFADFFANKIDKIHCALLERIAIASVGQFSSELVVCGTEFCDFVISQD
jgi:hypothetical protein